MKKKLFHIIRMRKTQESARRLRLEQFCLTLQAYKAKCAMPLNAAEQESASRQRVKARWSGGAAHSNKCIRLIPLIFRYISMIFLIVFLSMQAVFAEPAKVMSLNYDDNSALLYINVRDNFEASPLKLSRLDNPNRIYFDIDNAVLAGEKQQLFIEKSNIKEIRLSQFSVDPCIVRTVVTFDENFDTSQVELLAYDGNIILKTGQPKLANDYFNIVYDETPQNTEYSSIVVNSAVIQKPLPAEDPQGKERNPIVEDIQKAFENSTAGSLSGKTESSAVSVEISSDLKLRTKYFINGYSVKNGGILVCGLGQITTGRMFMLESPKRAVIDFPNTYAAKNIRNKELKLCPDNSCSDTAKIGQFEYNKARLVVTSENADKYIPVYSADAQSLLFIDTEKLDHTTLSNSVSNINRGFVRKIDGRTNELILSFTKPVVHSILRTDNSLNLYLFNVQSYNEQDLTKTLAKTYYERMVISLLPQIGVRASVKLNKSDIARIEQSLDGKALKIIITQAEPDKPAEKTFFKKNTIKGTVVLDAGHGGSDYGAIREGINEKDITLDVTQRAASILNSKGYKVQMTRTDDSFVSLEDRVAFAEDKAPEVFVSIHVNSAVATDPNGIETHYYHDNGKKLAKTVHSRLAKEIDAKDRGLFKSKFYVINHTTMPAVLVEIGFISNNEERAELISDKRKQKTAKAIAEGIIEYIKSKSE